MPLPLVISPSRTNGIRWMFGGVSRGGNGDSALEAEQTDPSRFAANRPFGSNAVYFLIFRRRLPGRYPKTLFGPGPISSAETSARKSNGWDGSCDSTWDS